MFKSYQYENNAETIIGSKGSAIEFVNNRATGKRLN